VLQTPYLLFYAYRNHDDIPDGDPEVLLSGFGIEDAYAGPQQVSFAACRRRTHQESHGHWKDGDPSLRGARFASAAPMN